MTPAAALPPARAAGPRVLWAMAALAALITLAERPPGLAAFAHGGLINPDSYMRLVRLQQALAAGGRADIIQADASGHGMVLYWSHLLDLVILALRLPLLGFLGGDEALRWAAACVGPLSCAAAGAACAWASAPLADRGWLWAGSVCIATSPAYLSYGQFGCAHHHVAVAAACMMMAGCAGRARAGHRLAGAGLGFWSGLGIWLSPEAMPFALLGFGLLGQAALRGAPTARAFLAAALTFTAIIGAGLLLDPPTAGLAAVEIDRISVVYLALGLALAALGLGLVAFQQRPHRQRIILGGALATGCLGLWLACFPAVARGPAGLLPPPEYEAFFGGIAEMEAPGDFWFAVCILLNGALGTGWALWEAWRVRSLDWAYAGGAGVLLVGLGLAHMRFAIYAESIPALLLPVVLTRTAAIAAPGRAAAARLLALFAVLWLPKAPALFSTSPAFAAAAPAGRCDLATIAPALRALGPAVALAHVNDSPELLYRTRLIVVGSLYHRNIAGFMRLRAAWRSFPSASIPPEVRDTGASYLLFCPSPGRSALLGELPEDTLLDHMQHGTPPPWLTDVRSFPGSDYRLYRIAVGP